MTNALLRSFEPISRSATSQMLWAVVGALGALLCSVDGAGPVVCMVTG